MYFVQGCHWQVCEHCPTIVSAVIALYSKFKSIPRALIQLTTTLECVKTKYVPKNNLRMCKNQKYASPVVQTSD